MDLHHSFQTSKEKLMTRQRELINQLRKRDKENQALIETASELTSFDLNHPGDTASALYERTLDMSLENRAERELDRINDSLHAIEEGTYGVCSVCGASIESDRLSALPTATTCQSHADIDDEID